MASLGYTAKSYLGERKRKKEGKWKEDEREKNEWKEENNILFSRPISPVTFLFSGTVENSYTQSRVVITTIH